MNALFAIYDTMQFVHADIETTCVGQAASAAAVLLAAGAPGKRYTLPHSRILIHQPHGGAQGQSVDIEIWAREVIVQRDHMVEILARHSGQTEERVRARHRPRLHPPRRRRGRVRPRRPRDRRTRAPACRGFVQRLHTALTRRVSDRAADHGIATPPFGRSICPVMKLDASDARYSTA